VKSVIEQHLSGFPEDHRIGFFREHLQKSALRALHESGHLSPNGVSFMGGTCLRMAYGSGRFSEDLDFALCPQSAAFSFEIMADAILTGLEREGYHPQIKIKAAQSPVEKAYVAFPGLLHECGLSPRPAQNFRIKIEVDTNPPPHSSSQRNLGHSHVKPDGGLVMWCYDIESLYAGKLAALLGRPWQKGRDVYDLIWLLSEKPNIKPNFKLLNAALRQGEPGFPQIGSDNWLQAVESKLKTLDWKKVLDEVNAFRISIPDKGATALFDKSVVKKMLHRAKPRR